MAKVKDPSAGKGRNTLILLGVVAALTVAGYNIYGQVSLATNGLPPKERRGDLATQPMPRDRADSGRLSPFGPGGPDGRGRMFSETERLQMARDIGLTEEQQQKLDEIMKQPPPSNPEEGRKRMEAMQEIMTPEQQQKAREIMRERMEQRMQRRLEEAKKLMNEGDYNQFKRKLEERRERMRNGQAPFPGAPPMGQWGRGGRGGPEGQPGQTQPPPPGTPL